MGCDIHSYVEKYDTAAKQWQYQQILFQVEIGEDDECWRMRFEPLSSRNYALFAFLAGVRNRWGIKPLAKPRGLPENVSSDVYEEYQKDAVDWHSASWFLLSELLAVDYEQKAILPNNKNNANFINASLVVITLRDFIYDPPYFRFLDICKNLGVPLDQLRLVFWFDN